MLALQTSASIQYFLQNLKTSEKQRFQSKEEWKSEHIGCLLATNFEFFVAICLYKDFRWRPVFENNFFQKAHNNWILAQPKQKETKNIKQLF